MRRSFRTCAALVALLAMACVAPWSSVAAERAAVVVVYGDSLTAGTGLPSAQREQRWIRRVESLADGRLALVDEGRGGRWARDRGEFDAMLARRQAPPDVLVMALGTNDSADLSDEGVLRTTLHVARMVVQARKQYGADLRVLIVAPPDVRVDALKRDRANGPRRAMRLRRLQLAFGALAPRLDCAFVDLHGVVPRASLASDGMHPDVAGNERIARAVLPTLLALAAARP